MFYLYIAKQVRLQVFEENNMVFLNAVLYVGLEYIFLGVSLFKYLINNMGHSK